MAVRKNQKTEQRAVIYARYSSRNQKEESIEQQVEECMAFAEETGIEVLRVYSDEAISGRTDRRPQFQRMMRDAERGLFDVVIAYKSNRISRDMMHALIYESKLDEVGVRILYAKEEFGNTAAGRFALRTMMNVNQFYSENLSEDVLRGMMDNAENYKVNGTVPFGYQKGPDGRHAIKEDAAEAVREIYRLFLADVAITDILDDLNEKGFKTARKMPFTKSSLNTILANDIYIGTYRFNGIVAEDVVPPILEKEMFYAVQEKLKTKKNPRGRHRDSGDYFLTGKLYCGPCGSHMVGLSGTSRNGEKHHYYVCNKRRTEAACTKENVRRDWIEQKVAEMTKQFVLRSDVITWIAENAIQFQEDAFREAGLANLEQDLIEKKKARRNMMNAIEQGIITPSTKQRLIELETDVESIQKKILAFKATNKPIDKERLIYAMEKLKNSDTTSKAHQKVLIDSFVKSVRLWDDHIEIDYYYAGNKSTDDLPGDIPDDDDFYGPYGVRIETTQGYHCCIVRTKAGAVELKLLADHFVLIAPLFMG